MTDTRTALRQGPTLAEMRRMTAAERKAQLETEWADCGGMAGLAKRGRA